MQSAPSGETHFFYGTSTWNLDPTRNPTRHGRSSRCAVRIRNIARAHCAYEKLTRYVTNQRRAPSNEIQPRLGDLFLSSRQSSCHTRDAQRCVRGENRSCTVHQHRVIASLCRGRHRMARAGDKSPLNYMPNVTYLGCLADAVDHARGAIEQQVLPLKVENAQNGARRRPRDQQDRPDPALRCTGLFTSRQR